MGYSFAKKGPNFLPLFPKNGKLTSEKSLYNLEYLGPIRLKIGSNDLPGSYKKFMQGNFDISIFCNFTAAETPNFGYFGPNCAVFAP